MNRGICMRSAVPAALVLLLALSAFAQTSGIRVDGDIIKSYITTMSQPGWMGRKTLTPGYDKAAEWAAGKFKEWGLKPAGDNGTFFQAVPIKGDRANFAWTSGIPELIVNGREFLAQDDEFAMDVSSAPGARADAEVVFVGYGISAPGKGLDEYAVDVKGRIVLAFKGSPADAPAGRSMFGPQEEPPADRNSSEKWTEESDDMHKAKVAYEKGAAGILLYNPDRSNAFANRFGSRRQVEASPFTRPFLFISDLDERAFRAVMSRDPQESTRGFGTRIDQIRRDIKDKKVRSEATGIRARIKGYDSVTYYGEKFNNNISRNVLAKIEGTDPALKNQYVIMGGHLDHLGATNEIVYNGADDNASGSAVTMEVARLLALNKVAPKRTIIFGLWCGEELGLLGSRHYTTSPSDGVSMDRVVAYFNMDMVGLGDEIGAPGALNFPEIYDVIMRDQDPAVAKLVKARTGGPGGSDHSGFIEQGIEALALMTSGGVGHPDYHDAADDSEKIQPEILAKTGQFVLQGALNLANETSVSLLIPDREHIYNAMRLNVPDITGEGGEGWRPVKAESSADLLRLCNDRAKALKRSQSDDGPMSRMAMMMRRMRGGSSARAATGIGDASVFDGSIPLLETAAALLDFGRVDVVKSDGAWFNSGVTEAGRAAVKAMEKNNISVNLVNPSPGLLGDMLDAAGKPFILTVADVTLQDDVVRRMKEKNVLLAIECSPESIQGCVDRLEAGKTLLGADSLLLSMTAGDKPEESKRSLYMALIKNGWTKDEIYAMAGISPNGRPGGNLTKLQPREERSEP